MIGAAQGARPRLLITSTMALWVAQMIGLIGGLVRGKFSAVYLGPAGVGLIAQLNYLSTLIATVAVFGMWNGSIKLLAEAVAKGDTEREARLRSITLFYPLVGGLLVACAIALVASRIGGAVLGSSHHTGAIVVAAFSVPVGLLGSALGVGLQARGEMRRLATANTLTAIVSTALVVVLVVVFGLRGAIAGVLLTSVVTAVVFAARQPRLFEGVSFRPSVVFDRRLLRAIYSFGAAAIILSAASSLTDLGVRTLIVHKLGIVSNGLYQPVTMLSTQLFLALVAALGMYLFPRLSALYASGDHETATAEVNTGVRLLVGAAVPAIIFVITLAPVVLKLVFSGQFVSAQSALTWQMAGEVFRALAWTIGAVLLPLGLIRLWLGIGLLTLAVQAALAAALVFPFGIVGVSVAYSISWLVNAAVATVAAYRRADFRLEPRTARLVTGSLIATAASMGAAQFSTPVAAACGLCLLIAWFGATVRMDSIRMMASIVRGGLR